MFGGESPGSEVRIGEVAHMVLRMWLWRRMSLLWACEPGAEVFRGELSRRLHMERRGKMLTVGEAK